MILEESTYIKHYGVKGMTWGSTQTQTLDRVYRVAAGTESRKAKLKKALKKSAKEVIKEPVKMEALPEETKKSGILLKDFLEQVGPVRLADLESSDE